MAATSEVGHAKNVANFHDLITFANGYGATYNPTKNSLKLPQLNTLYTKATADLSTVIAKKTNYNNIVNHRVETFSSLRTLATRLVNALDATDATPEKIEDAKGLNRKLRGQRASKTQTPQNPNLPIPNTISSSQLSYDQLIQHFQGLIAILDSEPSYNPNETELQIATLQTKLQQMENSNQQVAEAYATLSNARIERNKTLYNEETGLVSTAIEIKKYIKSVFGANSPEFGQIKGIKFKIV